MDKSTQRMDPAFFDALGAYCDGTLSRDDALELSMTLVESSAARQAYITYMHNHAVFEDEFTSLPDVTELGGFCMLEPSVGATSRPRSMRIWGVVAAIAAIVLVGFVLFPRSEAPPTVAVIDDDGTHAVTIVSSFGVQWRDAVVREGRNLQLGKPVRLESGALHMKGHNGIEFLLEGPAELVFNSDMESTLQFGRLSVRVPPSMMNYTVHTPDASVVDLGTEFGVAAGPIGTEAHVFDGRVSLAPKQNALAAKELHAGEAGVVRHGASEVLEAAVLPRAFASQPASLPLDVPATGNGFVDGKDQFWTTQKEGEAEWRGALPADPKGVGSLLSPTLRQTSLSRWIRYEHGQLPDDTRYLFRVAFMLPTYATGKIRFRIRHSADDLLDEVHLNDRMVWRETDEERQQPYANSDRFQDLELREVVGQGGENALTFYVLNGDTAFPGRKTSPMMFRAEIEAVFERDPLGFAPREE